MDKDSSDEWLPSTPPDLRQEADDARENLLPSKSRTKYESTYESFVSWKKEHKTKSNSESIVLAYFNHSSKKYKPSILWSLYSMLRSTLKIKDQVDIGSYMELKAFMKKKSTGFVAKKSKVLSPDDIDKFLANAPDSEFLATKVALIFGISGACRSNELVNVKTDDITRQAELLVVTLPVTKTNKPRTFVIAERFAETVQRYWDLRPAHVTTDRFFLGYRKNKCTVQVIGIHKFSQMPKEIAAYLKLDDAEMYTGHAFRRTSATLLADSGANITTLKRHGGWKSSNVAEGYIEESISNKTKISKIFSSSVSLPSTSTSNENVNAPPTTPQPSKIGMASSALKEKLNVAVTAPSEKEPNVFHNCSFVIHNTYHN